MGGCTGSARRPAALRTRYTNRLDPENAVQRYTKRPYAATTTIASIMPLSTALHLLLIAGLSDAVSKPDLFVSVVRTSGTTVFPADQPFKRLLFRRAFKTYSLGGQSSFARPLQIYQ